jgi:hypothetical protein
VQARVAVKPGFRRVKPLFVKEIDRLKTAMLLFTEAQLTGIIIL